MNPASITAGRGPHPAASPFDKGVSDELGITAFEIYQVELPPGARTVAHDHLKDQSEDVYLISPRRRLASHRHRRDTRSTGEFIAVTIESTRQLQAGDGGLDFVAVCSTPPTRHDQSQQPEVAGASFSANERPENQSL